MPDQPLAYFLTFGTYGSRLHGDTRGSVDRHHVELRRDDFRRGFEERLMVSGGFEFEAEHRSAVQASFAETAALRSWTIRALNVRMSHLHVVIAGDRSPELVMHALKANATRWLRERTALPREQKVWARHGSTRYLWKEWDLEAAIDYTLHRQGADLPGSNPSIWRHADSERRGPGAGSRAVPASHRSIPVAAMIRRRRDASPPHTRGSPAMQFTSETTEQGVTERAFTLDVAGEKVPGIVWTPEGAKGPRPVILMGHGGTQHKRVDTLLARARAYARHQRWASVAIDAPSHGDRTTPEAQAAARANIQARIAGRVQGFDSDAAREMAKRTASAVPEWRATLDAIRTVPEVGEGPVGYWGVSMGTGIGVPFLASESRVECAVLGLNGLRPGMDAMAAQAASITIPLLFVFQRHDELVNVEAGLALYDAFGSKEKAMHINPGGHVGIPDHERGDMERFFLRHLGPGGE